MFRRPPKKTAPFPFPEEDDVDDEEGWEKVAFVEELVEQLEDLEEREIGEAGA